MTLHVIDSRRSVGVGAAMLAQRADIWVPPPSRRAMLHCTGILTVLLLATVATHVAVPRAGPVAPGMCQRQAASHLPAEVSR